MPLRRVFRPMWSHERCPAPVASICPSCAGNRRRHAAVTDFDGPTQHPLPGLCTPPHLVYSLSTGTKLFKSIKEKATLSQTSERDYPFLQCSVRVYPRDSLLKIEVLLPNTIKVLQARLLSDVCIQLEPFYWTVMSSCCKFGPLQVSALLA
jgi:hypothetical protein